MENSNKNTLHVKICRALRSYNTYPKLLSLKAPATLNCNKEMECVVSSKTQSHKSMLLLSVEI